MNSLLDSLFKFFKSTEFQNTYKLIFGTPQFPVWFFIQAIWECYLIKRSQMTTQNTSSKVVKKADKRKKAENKNKRKEDENKNSENNDENLNKNGENSNNENTENLDKTEKNIKNTNEENEAEKPKSSFLSFKKIIDLILSYILCFAMNFLQRELFALLFKMPSPVKKNSKLILFFTIIFFVIFCFPFDIVFKIIYFKPFSFILGFLQGANQIRFFRLTLRHATKLLDSKQYIPAVIGFLVFDSFIGFFFGPLFNRQGRRTKVSNGNTICYYTLFSIIYFILTIPNNFSRDFLNGIRLNETHAAFLLVIVIGLYNAINSIKNDHNVCIKKSKKKKID